MCQHQGKGSAQGKQLERLRSDAFAYRLQARRRFFLPAKDRCSSLTKTYCCWFGRLMSLERRTCVSRHVCRCVCVCAASREGWLHTQTYIHTHTHTRLRRHSFEHHTHTHTAAATDFRHSLVYRRLFCHCCRASAVSLKNVHLVFFE